MIAQQLVFGCPVKSKQPLRPGHPCRPLDAKALRYNWTMQAINNPRPCGHSSAHTRAPSQKGGNDSTEQYIYGTVQQYNTGQEYNTVLQHKTVQYSTGVQDSTRQYKRTLSITVKYCRNLPHSSALLTRSRPSRASHVSRSYNVYRMPCLEWSAARPRPSRPAVNTVQHPLGFLASAARAAYPLGYAVEFTSCFLLAGYDVSLRLLIFSCFACSCHSRNTGAWLVTTD